MLKLDREHVRADLAAVEALLAGTPPSDVLGRMGLEFRRRELKELASRMEEREERRAKVALYFGGEPVSDGVGIQAGFAANVVGTFQDLVSKVWGFAGSESAAQLHITKLLHGSSFGFLLEELNERGEPLFATPLSAAVHQVAESICNFASAEEARFSVALEQMHPGVFQTLRQFFGCLYRERATFRLVEGERDAHFDRTAVERAWRRADESNVEEEEVHAQGRLLGVIPVGRRFEFEPDREQRVLKGKVSDEFTNTYLERIHRQRFAGRRWSAVFEKRIVSKIGRPSYEAYTLMKLEEI